MYESKNPDQDPDPNENGTDQEGWFLLYGFLNLLFFTALVRGIWAVRRKTRLASAIGGKAFIGGLSGCMAGFQVLARNRVRFFAASWSLKKKAGCTGGTTKTGELDTVPMAKGRCKVSPQKYFLNVVATYMTGQIRMNSGSS
jgi:hypothetical protein